MAHPGMGFISCKYNSLRHFIFILRKLYCKKFNDDQPSQGGFSIDNKAEQTAMKKGSHFFIQEFAELEFFHGGVGLIDAEKILLEEGYQPIHFPHQFNFSIKAKIERLIYLIRTITGIPKGSTLVFIFPLFLHLQEY